MPLKFTPQMKQRLDPPHAGDGRSARCGYFPELKDAAITIGYTRKHLGSATVIYRKAELFRLIIRLQSAQGHLPHHRPRTDTSGARLGLRQPLRHPPPIPIASPPAKPNAISGPGPRPAFLGRPADLHKNAAHDARTLAGLRRIGARTVHRRNRQTPHPAQYIRWLEQEIRQLAKAPKREKIQRLSAIVFAVRDLTVIRRGRFVGRTR